MPHALILLPTYDHQDTLYASIGAVLAQTITQWQLVIILDGAPPKSHAIANAFASLDPRITIVAKPKGARLGEAYRDAVIRANPAEFVFQINDDDLWLPNHLEILSELLETADFVHGPCLRVYPDHHPCGSPSSTIGVFTAAEVRRAIQDGRGNVAGPAQFAYRRSSYLQLPEGWTTTPATWSATDIFMIAKLLSHRQLRVASLTRPTSLSLHASFRRGWAPERRAAELLTFQQLLTTPHPELELSRTMIFERDLAGWCLNSLQPGPELGLDDVLRCAGLRPIVVDTIELGALNALSAGRATVTDTGYDCQALADILITPVQREQLEALLGGRRQETAT
jgi:hypothetical protein